MVHALIVQDVLDHVLAALDVLVHAQTVQDALDVQISAKEVVKQHAQMDAIPHVLIVQEHVLVDAVQLVEQHVQDHVEQVVVQLVKQIALLLVEIHVAEQINNVKG